MPIFLLNDMLVVCVGAASRAKNSCATLSHALRFPLLVSLSSFHSNTFALSQRRIGTCMFFPSALCPPSSPCFLFLPLPATPPTLCMWARASPPSPPRPPLLSSPPSSPPPPAIFSLIPSKGFNCFLPPFLHEFPRCCPSILQFDCEDLPGR
eukprot:GHVT01018324.1.p1 GENE.GHVT01018324.1~~GHVT01018324.1.p1  ORF type:complete len:152 (-),score=23.45 GHVT01018324.1:44-499(-)